jgi:hypothetical protein
MAVISLVDQSDQATQSTINLTNFILKTITLAAEINGSSYEINTSDKIYKTKSKLIVNKC